MPFLSDASKQPGQVVIGSTKFENPANPGEEVVLHICKATVHVIDEEVTKSYNTANVGAIRSLLNSYTAAAL